MEDKGRVRGFGEGSESSLGEAEGSSLAGAHLGRRGRLEHASLALEAEGMGVEGAVRELLFGRPTSHARLFVCVRGIDRIGGSEVCAPSQGRGRGWTRGSFQEQPCLLGAAQIEAAPLSADRLDARVALLVTISRRTTHHL